MNVVLELKGGQGNGNGTWDMGHGIWDAGLLNIGLGDLCTCGREDL